MTVPDRKLEPADFFRFMVISRELKEDKKWNEVHFKDVFSTVVERGGFPCGLPVVISIGTLATPEHAGKRLGLMLHQYVGGKEQFREAMLTQDSIPGEGSVLVVALPGGDGPRILPVSCRLRLPEPGRFLLDLYDQDGAFGEPGGRLASYAFEVRAE